MGADLTADAVLERRDYLPAGRVILGVAVKTSITSKGKTHRIPFNLDVPFLHDVEQADLNFAHQIRQFVDREYATVSARKKPEMNGQLVR